MSRTPIGNGELLYQECGSGAAVLLVPGYGCDHTIWALVEPALRSTYRTISFDHRGTGQSSSLDGPCSIAPMMEDAAALLQALGISRVHVAGHSTGGQIALELAAAHPEMVRSLTLLSSCAWRDACGKWLIEVSGRCLASWTRERVPG